MHEYADACTCFGVFLSFHVKQGIVCLKKCTSFEHVCQGIVCPKNVDAVCLGDAGSCWCQCPALAEICVWPVCFSDIVLEVMMHFQDDAEKCKSYVKKQIIHTESRLYIQKADYTYSHLHAREPLVN
jgi:hypothetical protein